MSRANSIIPSLAPPRERTASTPASRSLGQLTAELSQTQSRTFLPRRITLNTAGAQRVYKRPL